MTAIVGGREPSAARPGDPGGPLAPGFTSANSSHLNTSGYQFSSDAVLRRVTGERALAA